MVRVVVYTRDGCHLCDEVIVYIKKLQPEYSIQVDLIDIDKNEKLQSEFFDRVPVVEIGSTLLESPIDPEELKNILANETKISSGQKEISATSKPKRWSTADKITLLLSRHYLAVFNSLVFIYVALPFLAPVFLNAGMITPARFIYKSYGLVCHQLSYRSLFILGDQAIYPRAAAGLDHIHTFEEAVHIGEGNSPREIIEARNFTGNEFVGFKVALCQRDVAIYAAILLFGLLYGISGKRIPALPWYLWVLFGLVPIGLDGVSQILSQPPFNLIPYRESTPLLRILTGALFGFTTAWFGYPLVEETMSDSRKILEVKYSKIHQDS